MANKINPADLVELPDETEMIYGRRHIKELYGRAAAFDISQYNFWVAYFEQMALSAFEWEGLPDGIDARAVEWVLLHNGAGAIFRLIEDTEIDSPDAFAFAQAANAGIWNINYQPNEILLTAPNGQTWTRHCQSWATQDAQGLPSLHLPDAAICWDNLMRYPLMQQIRNSARRIAQIDRVIDVNIAAQRTPWILRSNKNGRKNAEKTMRKLDRNEQFILVDDGTDINAEVEVLRTDAPYVADKLQESKTKIINETLTLLGVDNTNNEKRERMIDAEATSNNEQIMLLRRSRLEARRQFAETANHRFGFDIYPRWGVPHQFDNTDGMVI